MKPTGIAEIDEKDRFHRFIWEKLKSIDDRLHKLEQRDFEPEVYIPDDLVTEDYLDKSLARILLELKEIKEAINGSQK